VLIIANCRNQAIALVDPKRDSAWGRSWCNRDVTTATNSTTSGHESLATAGGSVPYKGDEWLVGFNLPNFDARRGRVCVAYFNPRHSVKVWVARHVPVVTVLKPFISSSVIVRRQDIHTLPRCAQSSWACQLWFPALVWSGPAEAHSVQQDLAIPTWNAHMRRVWKSGLP